MKHQVIKKQFKIKSSLGQMYPLVNDILSRLKEAGLSSAILDDIKLAAEEALINAIKHGNRFKEDLPVTVNFKYENGQVSIAVQDKGKGYDYDKVPDPTIPRNITKGHGRGVYLIRQLMDEVRFNKSGNKIQMIKHVSS